METSFDQWILEFSDFGLLLQDAFIFITQDLRPLGIRILVHDVKLGAYNIV